jgi:hypothetical protein
MDLSQVINKEDAPVPNISTETPSVEPMERDEPTKVKEESTNGGPDRSLESPAGGAPTRQWLNSQVTPALLVSMRKLVQER